MKIEYKEFMMMMFVFVIILSFLAVGPLNYLHLSWGTTSQSKRPIPCHIFSILCVSYKIKYSFRDPVESAVRKRVVLSDVLLPFSNSNHLFFKNSPFINHLKNYLILLTIKSSRSNIE